jgi:endonuclease/exonuclease/phosphatase family metal-dependent hydrolase
MNDLPAGRVKIMTWNIWWRFGPHWQDRQAGLLQTLRQVDADVVALQEVWGSVTTSQAHEFADQLGMHAGFVAPSYPPISDVQRRRMIRSCWVLGYSAVGDPAAVTLPSSYPFAPIESKELIDQRIDHIFFRPGEWAQRVKVESTMLAGEAVDGVYPSDHRAAVCELSWSAGS